MKILNISLDQNIFDRQSEVAQRAQQYGQLVDKYFVVVPGSTQSLSLSDNVAVQGIAGNNKSFNVLNISSFLKKKLSQEKFDLITVQDPYFLALLSLNIAKKFGLKVEIQVHGFEKLAGLRKLLAKLNLRRADLVRVVSQKLKTKLSQEFGVAEDKIYIAPVGVDINKISHSQPSSELQHKYQGKFVFLTISRLVPVKNIDLQIEALAKLNNKNIQLLIAGDGPAKDNLKNLVAKYNLTDQVDFVGWLDNLGQYYKTADCLLLTSDSEGYGMVAAEAVAANLPVIMTDVGVAGELVVDEVNGFVIPINDQQALIQKMSLLIKDKNLLNQFSQNADKFKNKILAKQDLMQKVLQHWQSLI
jgi:glycosyltransferase involved in cell wall biosynthesis